MSTSQEEMKERIVKLEQIIAEQDQMIIQLEDELAQSRTRQVQMVRSIHSTYRGYDD